MHDSLPCIIDIKERDSGRLGSFTGSQNKCFTIGEIDDELGRRHFDGERPVDLLVEHELGIIQMEVRVNLVSVEDEVGNLMRNDSG